MENIKHRTTEKRNVPNYAPYLLPEFRIRKEEQQHLWMKIHLNEVESLWSDICRKNFNQLLSEKDRYKYVRRYYMKFLKEGLIVNTFNHNYKIPNFILDSPMSEFIQLLETDFDYYEMSKEELMPLKMALDKQRESVCEMLDFYDELEKEAQTNLDIFKPYH